MLMISLSIGVMAYNEEKNIGRCLDDLLSQRLTQAVIREILVISSGSTDSTDAIVRQAMARDRRIRFVRQARREGKASAVNLFIQKARSLILILVGADLRLPSDTIERLVEPFTDPQVGMTGGHPIPINDRQTLSGFAAHLLWDLHHRIALKTPKLGELVAFRKIFARIPPLSAVDEANIEPLILGQGFELRYVPEATFTNKGPTTIREFLAARRRIYAGHLATKNDYHYQVATLSGLKIISLLIKSPWLWRHPLWTSAVIALEIYGRWLGWLDYRIRHRSHAIWEVITTSKDLV